MKVNVKGYGRIPGTNMLAPKLGIDMTREQILTASTSPDINVYDAKTHVYITRANIDKFFEIEANEQVGLVSEPVVEKKTEVVEKPVVVEPVVNNEVSITSETDEVAEVEAVEIVENEVDEVADVVEVASTVEETVEEVVEEKPYQFKKKNKKKH